MSCSAGAGRPRLHHRRAPDQVLAIASGWADADLGGRDRVRHRRAAQGQHDLRDHDLPQRAVRPDLAQARGARTALAGGGPGAPRLHRQRDGGPAARDEFIDPFGGFEALGEKVLRTPGTAGGVVRRRPAAHAARGQVRGQAGVHRRARRARRNDRRWPSASRSCRPSGSRSELTKLMLTPDPALGLDVCWCETGLADEVLPELSGAAAGDRRAPPAQGRLRAHAHRARAGDRAGAAVRA